MVSVSYNVYRVSYMLRLHYGALGCFAIIVFMEKDTPVDDELPRIGVCGFAGALGSSLISIPLQGCSYEAYYDIFEGRNICLPLLRI